MPLFDNPLPKLSMPDWLRSPLSGEKKYAAPSNVLLAQKLRELLEKSTLPTPVADPHPAPVAPPPGPPPGAAPPVGPPQGAAPPMPQLGPTPEPMAPPTVYGQGRTPPTPVGPPTSSPSPMGPPVADGSAGSGSIWDNPDALNQILGMEGTNRKLNYAEKLREMETPEGRYTGGGRMYTAAHPIEHMGTIAARLRGKKDVGKYSEELAESRKKLLEFLRNK